MAGNRTRLRCFVDALCPLRDNRNWWWWWHPDPHRMTGSSANPHF
jgi:hypothetical protein